ncbi:hypothetical protein C8R44DRAFT_893318 [Mycena epipterygia]|nr:hypothetical protein C8R44DRAFT_893318 [Mycena epipterygia]
MHDLTQVLFSYTPLQTTPSTSALRVLLSSLTVDGCIDPSTKYLTFRILLAAHHWFQDSNLRAVLQEHSVWSALGAFNSDGELDITVHYIALGDKLSKIPEWKTIISHNLPGWLSHLPRLLEIQEREIPTQEFCAVLARIWDVNVVSGEQFRNEMPIAMAFMALARIWDQFDITPEMDYLIPHIKCTVSTALLARIRPDEVVIGRRHDWRPQAMSQRFKDTIIIQLGDAVMRAAERASQALNLNQDLNDTVTAAAELLSRLGWMILGLPALGVMVPVPILDMAVTMPIQGFSKSVPSSASSSQFQWYNISIDAYVFPGSQDVVTANYATFLDSGTTLKWVPTPVAEAYSAQFSPPATRDFTSCMYVVGCDATAPEFAVVVGGVAFTIDLRNQVDEGPLGLGIPSFYAWGDVFLHNVVPAHNPVDAEVTLIQWAPY